MSENFFNTLGSTLESQFSLGENKLKNLDLVKNGQVVPYGKLGEIANNIDQSAQRTYTEEGWSRNSLFNPKPKQAEIWWQEPDVTVLVKKRAFSSLSENYRPDLLNKDEQLFIRATKFLFQNKCKQIAAYEKLTKIESISTEIGQVDYHLLPTLFAATDTLDIFFNQSDSFNKFKNIVNRIRTIINLSHDNIYTTWVTNVLDSFRTDLGEGTGIIEFTTVFNVDTTTSINFGQGSFNLSFVDPYNLMKITHNDIEQAIADATNVIMGNSFVQLSVNQLNKSIHSDKELLNNIRAQRGASPIEFIVNPDTFLGQRVRAIIENRGLEIKFEGSVVNVNIDPGYLKDGFFAENDGLDTGSEYIIFSRIVRNTFNAIQINKNSRTIAKSHNANTNELRKKLRLHYGSKLIIQPRDVVHIFVNSKTQVDNKILGGLQDSFNAVGFLQTANKALLNLQDLFSVDKDSIEKSIFVGKDFPNWLWRIMRNQFTVDKSGTQIFAGLVDTSTKDYGSNGTFVVNVRGSDNTSYFRYGIVNYNPALDVWNGSLYDPITPFDIKFDRVTGFQKGDVPQLLPENKDLFKSAFVKFKNGVYVGKKPTPNNFINDAEQIQNNSFRRVFYDPDGMVYKWKEGIGTLVMFGNNYQENASSNASVPAITSDPFAGQDIMNALSLLITGEPYNFATFYKAASQFDNFGRDPNTGSDPSVSYFKNLQTDLKKRNLLYGNFVPFKKMSMDTNTYKNMLNNQIRADAFDKELNELLLERAGLNDRVAWLTNFGQTSGLSIEANNLEAKIADLDKQIDSKIQGINKELESSPLSIIGNDVSLDYDSLSSIVDKNKLSDTEKNNRDIRRRINFLTKRLSWKVRNNEDVNFFIVDDTYDKDYDIQAFEKDFINPQLFKSDYVTVETKIKTIADLLDLEVFADSQGHIQIRPPQYNKMPSSVFYQMLRLKSEFDIQLYPQFIEELYINQIDSIISRVEILEDEIRMYGLALSKSTDSDLIELLSTQTLNFRAASIAAPFEFISDESTGKASYTIIQDEMKKKNPDDYQERFSNGLNALDSLQTQSTINNIFSLDARNNVLKNLIKSKSSVNNVLSDNTIQSRSDLISKRLFTKTGAKFDLTQLFPNSQKLLGGMRISGVDFLKIMDEIAFRISERQRILKIAASALQNAKEGLEIMQDTGKITNKLLTPGLFNNSKIPQSFERLIEDESYDDYGPGSGKRYVIKNYHIKSYSVTENAPSFTVVEVEGSFNDNFKTNLPSDFQGFSGNGNALTTATAVDYDLWRMYGIVNPQSVKKPYLTSPDTQCAPFAVALLNKARKQIHSGEITVFGNEYMQPGEVVYVENEDMLFYVESINHRINYGSGFSTVLRVGHGHMPGEYIPTYLDAVGKVLYKNREITNFVSVRQNNVNSEEHIGTIIVSTGNNLVPSESILQGLFSNENREVLNMIIQSAESAFTVSKGNYQPYLELRTFYSPKSQFTKPSASANNIAQAIKDFLVGDSSMLDSVNIKQPSNWLKQFSDFIVPRVVNSDDIDDFRSPSSQCYTMARASLNKKSTSVINSNTSAIDNVIYSSTVDCWIYYKKI